MPKRVAALIRDRRRWGGEAAYFVAFNASSALNYIYLVAMGLLLGTESYGLFGALFGLVYLFSALGNTVQIAVARHVASIRAAHGGPLGRRVLVGAFTPALALAAVSGFAMLVLSPVLADTFHSSTGPVLWAGLAIALSVLVPAGYGILQGTERFARLGASLMVAAVFRLTAGGLLVAAGWGPSGALIGVAIGFAASGLVALAPATRRDAPGREMRVPGPSVRSLAAILVASVAIAVPTSLDVALVKHFFPAVEAGVFTAVAVMGRIVLFVPMAVSFIVLPKVAARISERRDPQPLLWNSLALTGLLAGSAAIVLELLISGLGWSPVGADISGAGTAIHWYLPAMVAFALVVAAVYYQIGRGNSAYVLALLLPGIAAQALLIVQFHGSLAAVGRAMFAVNFALLAASLLHAALPWLTAPRLPRLLSGWTVPAARRPEYPAND